MNINNIETGYQSLQKKAEKNTSIMISKIIRKVLRIHRNYLENIKNMWKVTKSTISLKIKDSESPKIIKSKNAETISDPKLIADNFNIFFVQ